MLGGGIKTINIKKLYFNGIKEVHETVDVDSILKEFYCKYRTLVNFPLVNRQELTLLSGLVIVVPYSECPRGR